MSTEDLAMFERFESAVSAKARANRRPFDEIVGTLMCLAVAGVVLAMLVIR